jgi:hypothetical protein
MSVVQTGVFASTEQLAQARKAFHEARETPVMRVRGLPPPGLIEGQVNHYGLLPTGEFNRYEPDAP